VAGFSGLPAQAPSEAAVRAASDDPQADGAKVDKQTGEIIDEAAQAPEPEPAPAPAPAPAPEPAEQQQGTLGDDFFRM
jgi:hypothetical protein